MIINSAATVFFSPTGTTKKILFAISQGLGINKPKVIDFTFVSSREVPLSRLDEDIVIIGVPVYEEKIPEVVTPSLEKLIGNGQPTVLVAVYGNIGYGIVLQELSNLSKMNNFKVVAAAAYIGEHSFSTSKVSVAQGRPDRNDLEHALNFGMQIKEKLYKIDNLNSLDTLPGHLSIMARTLPKNSTRLFTEDPKIISENCNRCNICIKQCPVSAIYPNTFEINTELCLRCFACVKKCNEKARKIVFKKGWLVSKFLKAQSNRRKEPVIFI